MRTSNTSDVHFTVTTLFNDFPYPRLLQHNKYQPYSDFVLRMAGPPSRGSDNSVWVPRGDDASSEREIGSAFRSVARGRGRGRIGGVRGGSSRYVSGRGPPDLKQGAPSKVEVSQGTMTADAFPKGRSAAKPLIRPSLAVNVIAVSGALDAPPESPTRSSRRRRPGHRRNASSVQAKPLAPPLADSVPSSPATHLMQVKDAKDFPPHLAGSDGATPVVHDLRQEISSLVDHVRTMAMDNKRPDSPGTHIDWAGDDDDSLPDLDDWFTTSKRPSDASESEPKTDDNADAELRVIEAGQQPSILQDSHTDVIGVSHSVDTIGDAATEKQTLAVDQLPQRRERKRERGGRKKAPKLDASAKKSLLDRLSLPSTGSPFRPSENGKLMDAKMGPSKSGIIQNGEEEAPVASKASSQCQDLDKPTNKASDAPVTILEEKDKKAPTASAVASEPRKILDTNIAAGSLKSSRAFEWSDEPMAFDSLPVFDGAPKGPSLDIKPPTPRTEPAALPASEAEPSGSLHVRDRLPRSRGQRPQSSDTTPRHQRQDRSPHKSHKANASMPSVSSSPNGRRQPHATRPILRVDALDMITRNLRESPARKPSPANSNSKESA